MRAYIDSDILIWHLRRERKALEFLRSMRKDPQKILYLGALQRAEIVFFMKPHERKDSLLLSACSRQPQSMRGSSTWVESCIASSIPLTAQTSQMPSSLRPS